MDQQEDNQRGYRFMRTKSKTRGKSDVRAKGKVAASKNAIRMVADELVQCLKAEGFTIQRYDAYSTESVYLKLDYGIAYTVRISNHPGKKHLRYTYNLIIGYRGKRFIKQKGTWRQFFSFDQVENLVTAIIDGRRWVKEKYHPDYAQSMEDSKLKNQGKAGFWAQAVLV